MQVRDGKTTVVELDKNLAVWTVTKLEFIFLSGKNA
jgi:hypothetical protein